MSVKIISECCKPFSPCDNAPCNNCEGISCLDVYDIYLTFSEPELTEAEMQNSPLYLFSNFAFSGRVKMESDLLLQCIHFFGSKDNFSVQYYVDEHEWAGGKHFIVTVAGGGQSEQSVTYIKRWGWTFALGSLRVVDDNYPACSANYLGTFEGQSANKYCEPGFNNLRIERIPPVMDIPPRNNWKVDNYNDAGDDCEFSLDTDPAFTQAINPVTVEWIRK